jgi:hypothetical protein
MTVVSIFYRTQRQADEGRAWFDTLAGSAVQHLTREIVDPAGSLARAGEAGDVDAQHKAAAAPAPGLPPEVLAQALEQFIHRHYAQWCDETIPALGGLTPRQAITGSAGLERIKGFFREHEDGERRQSAVQGRPAVSYQCLWDALGLSK